MYYTNIYSKLKELIGEEAQFCEFQEKAIHAIIIRQSPIVNIMATGKEKSILFMLSVYCVYSSTTIVIVPLCTLQDNLEDQYRKAYIKYV